MLQGSLNRGDAASSASGLYSFNSKGSGFIHSLISFFYSGIGAAAIPARLRLRKNFGERAFSPAAAIISVSFYVFVSYSIIYFLQDSDTTTFYRKPEEIEAIRDEYRFQSFVFVGILLLPWNSFSFFIITTLRKAYLHFKNIYSYSKERKYKYSYYRGDPINNEYASKIGKKLFGYTVDEKLIRIYYEPKGFVLKQLKQLIILIAVTVLTVLIFGIEFYSIKTLGVDYYDNEFVKITIVIIVLVIAPYAFTRLCLAFSGCCLLVEELAIEKKIRDTVLDMIDGEYDMQFILKERELLEGNKNTINQAMNIAESIFQYPDDSTVASFPADVANQEKQQVAHLDESKATIISPASITRSRAAIDRAKEKSKSIKKSSDNSLSIVGIIGRVIEFGFIVVFFSPILWLASNPMLYLIYGFFPFNNYSLNVRAIEAPANTEIILKGIEGGFGSTKLTFEMINNSTDTLRFPFVNSGDSRSVKILAKKTKPYLLNKYLNISSEDSLEVLTLKDEQNFSGPIIIPPNESKLVNLSFQQYGISTMRRFSLISEDRTLNKTFIRFNEVEF